MYFERIEPNLVEFNEFLGLRFKNLFRISVPNLFTQAVPSIRDVTSMRVIYVIA